MLTGLILLALGLTGAIGPIARLIPKSVTAGLQLGLGLACGWAIEAGRRPAMAAARSLRRGS